MVSSDGFVKILDFGLAKLVVEKPGDLSDALTIAGSQTASGVIVGTAGYMSPEQADARPLDFRSDQFSFGSILYEMLTGTRAFLRSSIVDTLSAILHQEPEPLSARRPETPSALRWLIERCLAKEPEDRYASTRDLSRDLAMLRDHLAESGIFESLAVRRGRRRALPLVAALLAAGSAGALVAFVLTKAALEHKPAPSYRQLTFRMGTIRSARFSPDGQSVVYAAAWSGQPLELFAVRPGAPESRSVGQFGANQLAVSSSGEMALVVRNKYLGMFPGFGTLARMPFEGGASPRDILEDVSFVDWSPDGAAMAIVHLSGGVQRLEYPIGTVLHETGGWISHPRVSPDGLRVGFLDHPVSGDDRGNVVVVDRAGRKTVGPTLWATAWGLAWPPGGKEVWFTGVKGGTQRELRALSLSAKERLVARVPAMLTLHDISRDGRVLLAQEKWRFGTLALPPGGTQERELSWLDMGGVGDISSDGRKILFEESGEGAARDIRSIFAGLTDHPRYGWAGGKGPSSRPTANGLSRGIFAQGSSSCSPPARARRWP